MESCIQLSNVELLIKFHSQPSAYSQFEKEKMYTSILPGQNSSELYNNCFIFNQSTSIDQFSYQ